MIVAGLGFRTGIAAEEIMDVLNGALKQAGLTLERLSLLATAASRASEAGFLDAAHRLGVEPLGVAPECLRTTSPQVRTHSERVLALFGVGSVAEAAALAAAGPAARLVVPRIAIGRATCAIARGSAA